MQQAALVTKTKMNSIPIKRKSFYPKIDENYLIHDQNITTKIVVYCKLNKIFLERRKNRSNEVR